MEIATTRVPRWFVRRDIDGLLGWLDNFIQILLLICAKVAKLSCLVSLWADFAGLQSV